MKPINKFSQLNNLSFKELIYNNEVRAIFFQIATIVLIVSYMTISKLEELSRALLFYTIDLVLIFFHFLETI